ncbi:MAG: hypothetical protein LBF75_09205 [Treponema sp.]|jgi:hypothetical protein|nr:hypothetical protein [Treponema sp.]
MGKTLTIPAKKQNYMPTSKYCWVKLEKEKIKERERDWACSITPLVIEQVLQNTLHFAVFYRNLFKNFSF